MTARNINELAAAIHEAAVAKGFWDVEDAEKKHLAKMISELGEVVQADRAGVMYEIERDGGKPEGVVAELADFAMMALDWLEVRSTCDHNESYDERYTAVAMPLHKYKRGETPISYYDAYELVNLLACLLTYPLNSSSINDTVLMAMYEIIACIEFWLKARGYDLWELIREKMAYNESRPKLHGRAY